VSEERQHQDGKRQDVSATGLLTIES